MLFRSFARATGRARPSRFCSNTRSAASAKVETLSARRFFESGSPPDGASLRLAMVPLAGLHGNANTNTLFPALGVISGVSRMNPDAVPAVPVLTATYCRPSTA